MADEFRFEVGEKVIFINENGVNFGEKTITARENDLIRGLVYYFEPTDTPWFATAEKHLYRVGDERIVTDTVVHYRR